MMRPLHKTLLRMILQLIALFETVVLILRQPLFNRAATVENSISHYCP